MAWSRANGRVSRAFNEWALIDRDQRAFLHLGLRIAREAYDRLWEEAGHEPGDSDEPELLETFESKVEGLWPNDYEWMFLAAVVRDAVTNFEVYLEKASAEVLAAHEAAFTNPPRWGNLRWLFDQLGGTIDSDRIREIRDLRHFLTHQRGELRTDEQRKKFAAEPHDGFPPIVVELSEDFAIRVLDDLAATVCSIDAVVWEHAWRGKRIPALIRRPPSEERNDEGGEQP